MSDTTIYSNEEELLTLMEEMQTEIETKDQTISRLTEYNRKWQEKVNSLSQELTRENPKALRKDLQDYKEKWKQENQLRKKAESRAEDALVRNHALSKQLERTEKQSHTYQLLSYLSLLFNLLLLAFGTMEYPAFPEDVMKLLHWLLTGAVTIGKTAYRVGTILAAITEKIPNEVIAAVLHWIILILITVSIPALCILLLYHAVRYFIKKYRKYGADVISLVFTGISYALLVYFGEEIRKVLPVNLAVLFLFLQGGYLAIRRYINGCMKYRGYGND